MPTVRFPAGASVPAIGQGTWRMGQQASRRQDEIHALQLGLDLGLRLIDTAELYDEAETVVGDALAGRREQAFVVSKVLSSNAGYHALISACERSLKRLRLEQLDLYLLHWQSSTPLDETLRAFETLIEQGKIAGYGVSNFDLESMKALAALPFGDRCQTDQVLYYLGSRGIEYDLLPKASAQGMPIMAYCPLAQGEGFGESVWRHASVRAVADKHGATPAQILLAWAIRPQRGLRPVVAIPKAVTLQHVRDNADALTITLDAEDLALLDQACPPPSHKLPLDIV